MEKAFGKTMGNLRKNRDIKLITREKTRLFGVGTTYNTIKFLTGTFLGKEMKKTETLMNKPVYLGLSILELCKILMCDFWFDYVWLWLCFVVYIKTSDIYEGIEADVKTRFDRSNFLEATQLDNKVNYLEKKKLT